MMNEHFTFFASYYDSVERLDSVTKGEFFDVLFKYALRNELPSDDINPVVNALFLMAKPNIDKSKSRQEAGRNGGKQTASKIEANASKPQANVSNDEKNASDKDKDKEKEKEKFNIGVFTPEQFSRLKSYRSMLKKPFKTQDAVTRMSNNFSECYALGYSFDDLFKLMAEKQWQSVEAEWVVKISQQASSNQSMTYEQRRLANQKIKVQVFPNGNYRDANGDLRDQYGFMS